MANKPQFTSQIERLETDLEYTMRAIDGKHPVLDDIFTNQAIRIRKEIEKLKENQ